MSYEVFARNSFVRVTDPALTITKSGRLAFNKAAAKILADMGSEYVLMLWDPSARKMGIQPITKKDIRAYRVTFADTKNTAGFHAKTFFDHIGYAYDKGTRSFPVDWNKKDGLFEIVVPEGEHGKRKTQKISGQ